MRRNLYGSTQLNTKQRRIVALIAEGLTNKEIASAIRTTENVTKNYMRTIYDKLGTGNRIEVALWHVHHAEN